MRIFLTLLLLSLSGAASAQWRLVSENEEASFYYNPATVRHLGEVMTVWVIADRRKPGPDGERSVRMQYEVDCGTREYQITYEALHDEPMAQGVNLATGHPGEWKVATPTSTAGWILKKICPR
ncbi:MAG: hypothetical protein EBT08_06665 [Betaproteobacteria bacterium]|nr:hypothetical protein [Betaproteobacteria bacterium]